MDGSSAMSEDAADRLRRARMTLCAAEERAGLRTVAERSLDADPIRMAPASAADAGSASLLSSQSSSSVPSPSPDGDRGAPVRSAGIRGSVLQVPSGVGELLRAVAAVIPEEGWVAFAGVRDVGWEAASGMGIDLSHVIDVPEPGQMAGDVVSALLDGVDVLCLGDVELRASQRRILAARCRRDSKTILVGQAWPGISVPFGDVRRARVLEAV